MGLLLLPSHPSLLSVGVLKACLDGALKRKKYKVMRRGLLSEITYRIRTYVNYKVDFQSTIAIYRLTLLYCYSYYIPQCSSEYTVHCLPRSIYE